MAPATKPGRIAANIAKLPELLKSPEAIAATYDRMNSIDPVRAEQVMSLIIPRHADAKNALKDLLSRDRQGSGHSLSRS